MAKRKSPKRMVVESAIETASDYIPDALEKPVRKALGMSDLAVKPTKTHAPKTPLAAKAEPKVEPKVEPINCRVKVSDMNARFDTFETLLNEALKTPIKNGASIDKCHCNEDEKYKSNISTNKIDIELKEAQETMAIIEEAHKAMAVEEAHKAMAQEEARKAMENVQNAQQ